MTHMTGDWYTSVTRAHARVTYVYGVRVICVMGPLGEPKWLPE